MSQLDQASTVSQHPPKQSDNVIPKPCSLYPVVSGRHLIGSQVNGRAGHRSRDGLVKVQLIPFGTKSL